MGLTPLNFSFLSLFKPCKSPKSSISISHGRPGEEGPFHNRRFQSENQVEVPRFSGRFISCDSVGCKGDIAGGLLECRRWRLYQPSMY